MQCNRCGVYFSRLDVVIGNCIPQGYGYRHTYREDCGDDVLPKSRSVRTVRELFVAPASPAPLLPHLPPAPPPTLPATYWAIVPKQATLFDQTVVQTMFGMLDDEPPASENDDQSDDAHLFATTSDQALHYGYAQHRYWVEYAGRRFEGSRAKHMKGVLLAIADQFAIDVALLSADDYKASPQHPQPTCPAYRVVVSEVLSRLPEPFQMRYTRNNLWELHYREHVIKERIKAVLAGYVVAIRAFV